MALLTFMVGAGVLGLPAVFANCGWVLGIVFVLVGSLVSWALCCALDDLVARGVRQGSSISQFKEIAAVVYGEQVGNKIGNLFLVGQTCIVPIFLVLIGVVMWFSK